MRSLLLAGILGFSFGIFAAEGKPMVVVPSAAVVFVPVDPARPEGAAMAVLWGDPGSGPSAMLLKMKKTPGALHFHTSDYHLALLEGTMRHWADGTKPEDVAPLGPGSYWFQPGGQLHGDACLTDECIMFIKWEGKRDGFLPEAPERRSH